jgi:hypothetical protein
MVILVFLHTAAIFPRVVLLDVLAREVVWVVTHITADNLRTKFHGDKVDGFALFTADRAAGAAGFVRREWVISGVVAHFVPLIPISEVQ